MPLYFVEKVVIYRRNFGKIKSPENPPYLEKKFAKYRLWPIREAHSLLGKGLNYVGDTAEWSQLVKKEELRTLVAAWTPLSRHGHFRACLDDAETSLFRIEGKEVFCMVPSLVASLNDCVSNDYDIEM